MPTFLPPRRGISHSAALAESRVYARVDTQELRDLDDGLARRRVLVGQAVRHERGNRALPGIALRGSCRCNRCRPRGGLRCRTGASRLQQRIARQPARLLLQHQRRQLLQAVDVAELQHGLHQLGVIDAAVLGAKIAGCNRARGVDRHLSLREALGHVVMPPGWRPGQSLPRGDRRADRDAPEVPQP